MIRRLLFWVLIIIFIWVVITQFDEIKIFAKTLAQGNLGWLLVATVLVLIYNLVSALSFRNAFAAADIQLRLKDLIPVSLASDFIGTVAPGGAATGLALYVDDAVRRGYSAARATVGLMLQLIADFTSLTIVMGIGMLYLFIGGELNIYTLLGVGTVLAIAASLVGIVLIGLWRPALLHRLFKFFQRMANVPAGWLKQPDFLEEGWAEESANEFIAAAAAMARNPVRLLRSTLLMLSINVIDIAILNIMFLSFGYDIDIAPLVAGFATITLATIVSPAPEGAGVVEGAMVYVFDALGVPWEINLTTALAYRGLTFWLPIIIGFVMLRRVKTFQIEKSTPVPGGSIPVLAFLIAMLGVFNILSVIAPSLTSQVAILEIFSPFYVPSEHALAAIASGIAMFVIALGLLRHKRLTWLASLILVSIVITAHFFVGGPKDQQLLLGAGIGIWLVFLAPNFTVRSDWPSIRRGLYVVAGAFALALVYGTVGFLSLDAHFHTNPDLWSAARQTALLFAQLSPSSVNPLTQLGQWFVWSIYLISLAALTYFLVMLDRPVQLRHAVTADEAKRARQIVEANGRSSMAYLALLDDKHYFFSPGGSLIAFAVRGRITIVLSDPIGPRADAAAAISDFRELCKQNDWIPAFCLTLPDYQGIYQEEGLRSVRLGQEGAVNLQTFTLVGRARKSYRKRYNRFHNQGYRVVFHQPPLPDELMADLREVSDAWLEITFGAEKRFFLGWFYDAYLRNCPVATVHDPQGRITAFANLVSEYQLNEITIDLVRHRGEIASGTMDFLFVSLFEWAKREGYESFNLGLSALSGIGGTPDAARIERMLHWVYENWSQRLNFKGLHEFKAKFRPSWTPQYLTFPSLVNLPSIFISMAMVNTGGRISSWGYPRRRTKSFTAG